VGVGDGASHSQLASCGYKAGQGETMTSLERMCDGGGGGAVLLTCGCFCIRG
jgi:hypothetical protein